MNDAIGSLRIYLTVLPASLADKPRRIKLAEYHKVTEQQARECVATFEQNNFFEGKIAARCSAVWTPYPVYL